MNQTAPLAIGPHRLPNRVFAAPMAGIADLPLRRLFRAFGAGYAVGEMTTSDARLRGSRKTARRLRTDGETEPVAVQLAGADPAMLADAARDAVDRGAQIIDINMGCPVKKVCNAACGSALLRDEPLVGRILDAVVGAVAVPVTLKIRTGWDPAHRNAPRVARMAQDAGIRMLTVHGRTRSCGFRGHAEYETIAEVKARLAIPVVANGDIDSPAKARAVLAHTRADALMIGRAAQGRPWIFRELAHFLATGRELDAPTVAEVARRLTEHLHDHYALYGEFTGVRSARKHIGWALRELPGGDAFRAEINRIDDCAVQVQAVGDWFARLAEDHERLPRIARAAANDDEIELQA